MTHSQGSPAPHSVRVIPHVTWRGDDVFRAVCNCGLTSWDFDTKAEAQAEADRHSAAVAKSTHRKDRDSG